MSNNQQSGGLAAVLDAAVGSDKGNTPMLAGTGAPATQPAPAPVDVNAQINAAVTAERDRIVAIDALAMTGFESLVADAKAKGETAGELAVKMILTIKAEGRLDAIAALTKASAVVPPIPASTSATGGAATSGQPALAGEAKWKADFASSEKLQAEFGAEAPYLAYMRAASGGRAKSFGAKS